MLIQLGQCSRLGFSTRTRTGRGRERTASSPACSRPPLPAATHGHGRRLFRRSAAPDECRMSWTRKRAEWHPTTGRRPASLACHAHSSSRRSLSSAARATGEPGGILSCLGIPPLLRSAYRAAGGADPSGVSMFRTRETGWFRGRVAGTHYRAPAPSEPDKPVFRASRLKQARTEHALYRTCAGRSSLFRATPRQGPTEQAHRSKARHTAGRRFGSQPRRTSRTLRQPQRPVRVVSIRRIRRVGRAEGPSRSVMK